MQLLNSLLKNLGRNFTQPREFLLRLWQIIELLNLSRKLQVRRKDVFLLQRASINQALTTIAPIFYLPQCIVIGTAADFHPLNELLLLSGVWIDSVTMSKCQHSSIVLDLLDNGVTLNVKFRDIESHKLNWGSPCIPTLTWVQVQRGSYSSPFPPSKDKR